MWFYVGWQRNMPEPADLLILPSSLPGGYGAAKNTFKTISLRLPESMLNELRQLANKRDIPYQSLIKVFLRERVDQEYQRVK